jgi:hypothetical protein
MQIAIVAGLKHWNLGCIPRSQPVGILNSDSKKTGRHSEFQSVSLMGKSSVNGTCPIICHVWLPDGNFSTWLLFEHKSNISWYPDSWWYGGPKFLWYLYTVYQHNSGYFRIRWSIITFHHFWLHHDTPHIHYLLVKWKIAIFGCLNLN